MNEFSQEESLQKKQRLKEIEFQIKSLKEEAKLLKEKSLISWKESISTLLIGFILIGIVLLYNIATDLPTYTFFVSALILLILGYILRSDVFTIPLYINSFWLAIFGMQDCFREPVGNASVILFLVAYSIIVLKEKNVLILIPTAIAIPFLLSEVSWSYVPEATAILFFAIAIYEGFKRKREYNYSSLFLISGTLAYIFVINEFDMSENLRITFNYLACIPLFIYSIKFKTVFTRIVWMFLSVSMLFFLEISWIYIVTLALITIQWIYIYKENKHKKEKSFSVELLDNTFKTWYVIAVVILFLESGLYLDGADTALSLSTIYLLGYIYFYWKTKGGTKNSEGILGFLIVSTLLKVILYDLNEFGGYLQAILFLIFGIVGLIYFIKRVKKKQSLRVDLEPAEASKNEA